MSLICLNWNRKAFVMSFVTTHWPVDLYFAVNVLVVAYLLLWYDSWFPHWPQHGQVRFLYSFQAVCPHFHCVTPLCIWAQSGVCCLFMLISAMPAWLTACGSGLFCVLGRLSSKKPFLGPFWQSCNTWDHELLMADVRKHSNNGFSVKESKRQKKLPDG